MLPLRWDSKPPRPDLKHPLSASASVRRDETQKFHPRWAPEGEALEAVKLATRYASGLFEENVDQMKNSRAQSVEAMLEEGAT